ncbi:hypothetical protein FISHEDRAFT_32585 [Fistulina hepatica ATCC 64428]|uniref:Uncharacterized protein n=1 Tax=Fistulina hepatica ATCC 64428 TaxID=1128425 RepID=A0A0D7ASP0_9AGAR|nr:hypothetical protein FISHEDRAFT_32585 [Fistulina hepatica ATCC 64428]
MEHILTDCQIPRQELIWEMVQEIWEKKGGKWSRMTLGKIMAAAIKKPRLMWRGQKTRGADRLYRILITEAAHLIWTLRCECCIHNNDDPDKWQTMEEIINRLSLARIDTRLALDRIMTSRKKFGKKAIKAEIVLQTWSGVLCGERDLPENWIVGPRFLWVTA